MATTLSQEWLPNLRFIVKYSENQPILAIFALPRVANISLRKGFQKRPIGNITVCNLKSPVFGIYVIARLYAIFFCVFPAPFFRISSEFLANNR